MESVLEAGAIYAEMDKNRNPYLIEIASQGGFPIIEKLQNHTDPAIYNIVTRIIDKYIETQD